MNETTQQEKTTQLGSRNETTQLVSRNETTQLVSRNETTQLVSRNETTQLCTAVDRLQPPAPPLQQNRLFLPTDRISSFPKKSRYSNIHYKPMFTKSRTYP
ncbi:hypothetical protein TNCV_861371 [Trichonephila clavipes]|nr:hypothetical protein TNCV_861371 [Trichonephila clavipes]